MNELIVGKIGDVRIGGLWPFHLLVCLSALLWFTSCSVYKTERILNSILMTYITVSDETQFLSSEIDDNAQYLLQDVASCL